jgi:hypothetical protein
MPNRYTRDELILIALNMAQLPNLEVHEAPDGVVQQDAYSIQWLQDILDFWYHIMPFSATVDDVGITCTANSDVIVLPGDFILDVRNGLEVQTVPGDNTSYRKIQRLSLQKFRNRRLQHQNTQSVKYPIAYCVVGDDGSTVTQYQIMRVTPTPTIATACVLWYYKLPAKLEANQRPKFPDDYACVEYIRLRALEWAGLMTPGTAKKFTTDIVSSYKASGLMNEPEDDEIPMDEQAFHPNRRQVASYNWMGAV